MTDTERKNIDIDIDGIVDNEAKSEEKDLDIDLPIDMLNNNKIDQKKKQDNKLLNSSNYENFELFELKRK